FIIIALTTNAQKIGFKTGYGLSGYKVNFYVPDGSKIGTGINAGFVGEFGKDDLFKFRFDVTFNQLGSDYDSRRESDESWGNRPLFELNYTTNVNYLQTLVSLKFKTGPLYVFVGPYFSYAFSGYERSTITPVTGNVQEWKTDIFSNPDLSWDMNQPFSDENNPGGNGDLYIKTDYGLIAGLGKNISNFFIEVNAGIGGNNFINRSSDYYNVRDYANKDNPNDIVNGTPNQKNFFIKFSVGYMFGF
ncbi:MAG: hypothetical protein GXO79_01420, partial [Chlorobi bacterium]|nr:hypothetical protein [Chlorobiota bacterium]